jgi:hypothetical protein
MWIAGSWILFGTEETKKRKTIAIAISLLPDSPRLKMAGELLCGMIYSIFWRVSPLWLKHRRGMNPSPRGDESERQSANSYPIENLTYTAPIPGRGTWHIGWRSGSLHCAVESITVQIRNGFRTDSTSGASA